MDNEKQKLLERFKLREGYNSVYYGKIRNGKTYTATADILDLLSRGEYVVANWDIDFKGFDQSSDKRFAMAKLISGDRYFFDFKKSNFEYIPNLDESHLPYLNKLVGCHLFIDEGHWIFNSHSRKDNPDARRLILEGGHYCRSLNVITQRPENILKDIRSQIHLWHMCEKVFHWNNVIRFVRYTTEEMKDTLPVHYVPDEKDPTKKKLISKTKAYWGNKTIYNSYSTYAMRSDESILKQPDFDYKKLSRSDIFNLLFRRGVWGHSKAPTHDTPTVEQT